MNLAVCSILFSQHDFKSQFSKALSFNRQTRSRDFMRHVKLFRFVAVALSEEILLNMFTPAKFKSQSWTYSAFKISKKKSLVHADLNKFPI